MHAVIHIRSHGLLCYLRDGLFELVLQFPDARGKDPYGFPGRGGVPRFGHEIARRLHFIEQPVHDFRLLGREIFIAPDLILERVDVISQLIIGLCDAALPGLLHGKGGLEGGKAIFDVRNPGVRVRMSGHFLAALDQGLLQAPGLVQGFLKQAASPGLGFGRGQGAEEPGLYDSNLIPDLVRQAGKELFHRSYSRIQIVKCVE